jgi:hypothetical protein
MSSSRSMKTTDPAFEPTSKRRKGFPSETNVKRGVRFVHVYKEIIEKLGRNDQCPCGSGRRFQGMLHEERLLLMGSTKGTISANDAGCDSSPRRPQALIIRAETSDGSDLSDGSDDILPPHVREG